MFSAQRVPRYRLRAPRLCQPPLARGSASPPSHPPPRGLRPRHFFARRAGMGMPARPALLLLLLAGAHARALELGRVLHLAGDEMDSRHARHCSTLFL